MLAAVAFAILPVRIKELVYGNVQQGDDLVKGIQAWMLTPVFKIHDRAWGTVYKLCKIFLRPTFRLSFALDPGLMRGSHIVAQLSRQKSKIFIMN